MIDLIMTRKHLLISAFLLLLSIAPLPLAEAQRFGRLVRPHPVSYDNIADVLPWAQVRGTSGYRVRWRGDDSKHWNYKNLKANER